MITIYQNRCAEFSLQSKKDAKYEMMMGAKRWQPEFAQYYVVSYEVATDDLEEAFELTNLWDDETEEKVNILNGPAPSSSVGDIFVVENGQCFIVDGMGFKQIANPFEV
jgi:hypothetical protein